MCWGWNDTYLGRKDSIKRGSMRREKRSIFWSIYENLTFLKRRYRWTRIDKNTFPQGLIRHIYLVFQRRRRPYNDRLVSQTSRRSKAERAGSSEERGRGHRLHPLVLRVWEKLQTRAWTSSISFLRRSLDDCPWLLFLYLENIALRLRSSHFQIILHIKRLKHMWCFFPNSSWSYLHHKNKRNRRLGLCWPIP